jgi:hypothetical protein
MVVDVSESNGPSSDTESKAICSRVLSGEVSVVTLSFVGWVPTLSEAISVVVLDSEEHAAIKQTARSNVVRVQFFMGLRIHPLAAG